MSRRLLLVSYHFGPDCETGGFRWNAITRALSEMGWEVDVLTAARPGREDRYEFGKGVTVHPVPVPNLLGGTIETVGRLRRWLAAPWESRTVPAGASGKVERMGTGAAAAPADRGFAQQLYSGVMSNLSAAARWSSGRGWSRRAARLGLELGRSRAPGAVVVSSPPHQTQLSGVRLASVLGVPCLADFRDPWIFGELDSVQSSLVDQRCGSLAQRRTFKSATCSVFNTAWAKEAAEAQHPSLQGRTATVPNGYDPRATVEKPDPAAFRVAFVGWLYDFMDPEPVLAACARLRARAALDNLRIEFIGTDPAPGGVSLIGRARRYGLEACFEHHARMSRDAAQSVQDRAAVRVVFDYPGPLRIPMKFYDAVQGYGDVLLVGRTRSALADAAAVVGLSVCAPDDTAAIDATLDRALARWRARAYGAPVDARGEFARAATCRKMVDLLERLLDGAAAESTFEETATPGPRITTP